MLNNQQFLPKLTITLVVIGLATMFLGSFSYRLSNPSLIKRISSQDPPASEFGNQEGMDTGMTSELMGHIGELMSKLAQNPDDFDTRLELAEHFLEVNDWKSASVHLERALAIKPDSVQANYAMGVALYSQDDFAGSAKAFERIVAAGQDPSAMFNLGILYAQNLNRLAEAKELFNKISTMDGIDHELRNRAKEALARLQ